MIVVVVGDCDSAELLAGVDRPSLAKVVLDRSCCAVAHIAALADGMAIDHSANAHFPKGPVLRCHLLKVDLDSLLPALLAQTEIVR